MKFEQKTVSGKSLDSGISRLGEGLNKNLHRLTSLLVAGLLASCASSNTKVREAIKEKSTKIEESLSIIQSKRGGLDPQRDQEIIKKLDKEEEENYIALGNLYQIY